MKVGKVFLLQKSCSMNQCEMIDDNEQNSNLKSDPPLLLIFCQAEGIFRINPENSHEDFVREQLNKGIVPTDIDIHALAGLIKVSLLLCHCLSCLPYLFCFVDSFQEFFLICSFHNAESFVYRCLYSHGNGTIGSVLENVTEVSYRWETLTCDLEVFLLNAADCVGNCPCCPVFSVFLRVGSLPFPVCLHAIGSEISVML
jgi:hypothetical protein